jgi:NAD(P)-dependent dehydrogenase (short-subunit alcohol dehydrogenase family)
VIALTHSLAITLGPDIRVNSISPGWIESRNGIQKNAEPLTPSDHIQHPAGRVGQPEDVASMVLWLADDKNSFVTGQDFIVDGGMTKKMIYL